jgi:hypothetical protein
MIAVAVGLLLGLVFRFYVLIPGTLALMLIGLVAALSRGDRLGDILISVLLPPVCLQAGYVLGLCLRELVKTTRDAQADAADADQARRPRRGRQPAVALAQSKPTFLNR